MSAKNSFRARNQTKSTILSFTPETGQKDKFRFNPLRQIVKQMCCYVKECYSWCLAMLYLFSDGRKIDYINIYPFIYSQLQGLATTLSLANQLQSAKTMVATEYVCGAIVDSLIGFQPAMSQSEIR